MTEIIGRFVGGGSCVNVINTSVKVQCHHRSVITAKYTDRSSVMEAFNSFFIKPQHRESDDGWMDGWMMDGCWDGCRDGWMNDKQNQMSNLY